MMLRLLRHPSPKVNGEPGKQKRGRTKGKAQINPTVADPQRSAVGLRIPRCHISEKIDYRTVGITNAVVYSQRRKRNNTPCRLSLHHSSPKESREIFIGVTTPARRASKPPNRVPSKCPKTHSGPRTNATSLEYAKKGVDQSVHAKWYIVSTTAPKSTWYQL